MRFFLVLQRGGQRLQVLCKYSRSADRNRDSDKDDRDDEPAEIRSGKITKIYVSRPSDRKNDDQDKTN